MHKKQSCGSCCQGRTSTPCHGTAVKLRACPDCGLLFEAVFKACPQCAGNSGAGHKAGKKKER